MSWPTATYQYIKLKKGDTKPTHGSWRQGDQRVFNEDSTKAMRKFGWQPTATTKDGVQELVDWVQKNKQLLNKNGII